MEKELFDINEFDANGSAHVSFGGKKHQTPANSLNTEEPEGVTQMSYERNRFSRDPIRPALGLNEKDRIMIWLICEKNNHRIHENVCLSRHKKKICPSWCSKRIAIPPEIPAEHSRKSIKSGKKADT